MMWRLLGSRSTVAVRHSAQADVSSRNAFIDVLKSRMAWESAEATFAYAHISVNNPHSKYNTLPIVYDLIIRQYTNVFKDIILIADLDEALRIEPGAFIILSVRLMVCLWVLFRREWKGKSDVFSLLALERCVQLFLLLFLYGCSLILVPTLFKSPQNYLLKPVKYWGWS